MYGFYLASRMVLCGVCAIAVWDLFAAVRSASGAKGFIGTVTDFLSPIAFGAVIWYGVLYIADGDTRLYEFICMGMGVILYIFTVKRFVYMLFYVVFQNIFKILGFIFKILLTPARFLYKMISVVLYAKSGADKAPVNGDDTDVKKN